jgi:hypothetical protein
MRCVNGSCTSSVKKPAQVLPKGRGQIAIKSVKTGLIVIVVAMRFAQEREQ